VKSFWVLAVSLAVAGVGPHALAQYIGHAPSVDARAVIHQDGTRSDVIKDPLKHEMTEITYDPRGVVISKKTYLLNENGDPTQGQIFDGAGNLIARVQFSFDDLQRLSEERCVNMQGEVFRRVLHQYDANGKALPVKAMDYKVNAPNMRSASIDFTHTVRPAKTSPAPAAPQAPTQPGSVPQIERVATSTGQTFAIDPAQAAAVQQQVQAQQAAAAKEESKKKKKGGFFGLFRKD
jgi:hypothetical protein